MNIKVMYHSSTGNTKKVASAIAETMKVTAEPIKKSSSITESVDLLFIGDGTYFGRASKHTLALINQLDPRRIKNVAVFSTYGGQVKVGAKMRGLLESRGLRVIGEPFGCKGWSWLVLNWKHPNQAELDAVRQFAKKAASRAKK